MPKTERLEDMEAWRKAGELAKAVYAESNEVPFSRDSGLREKMRREAASVVSNIAEGFERGGRC